MNSWRCFLHGEGGGSLVNLNIRSKTCPMFLVKSAMYVSKAAVVDGEEANLVILERDELCEMRRADLVQIFGCAVSSGAQDAVAPR